MIPVSKMREIAERLLEKSKRDEVFWTPQDRSGNPPQTFRVDFPDSTLLVSHGSPTTEPDYVLLTLRSQDGYDVGTWCVYDGDKDWELASGLFAEAQRRVTGWDRLLGNVERAISQEGPIGSPF